MLLESTRKQTPKAFQAAVTEPANADLRLEYIEGVLVRWCLIRNHRA